MENAPDNGLPGEKARQWAMFCHLSGLCSFVGIPSFLGPLVLWLIKKDEDAFIDEQGKEALNFQISVMIYTLVSFLLCFVLIGIPMLVATFIGWLVLSIVAAMKAKDGEHYRYPYTIRLIA